MEHRIYDLLRMCSQLSTMKLLIAALVIALMAVSYASGVRRARKEIYARFAGRTARSASEFWGDFYSEFLPGDLVQEALFHLASELDVPLEFLLPSDRFDNQLRPARGWGYLSGHGLLFRELSVWARAKGLSGQITRVETVDDYIRAFCDLAPESGR